MIVFLLFFSCTNKSVNKSITSKKISLEVNDIEHNFFLVKDGFSYKGIKEEGKLIFDIIEDGEYFLKVLDSDFYVDNNLVNSNNVDRVYEVKRVEHQEEEREKLDYEIEENELKHIVENKMFLLHKVFEPSMMSAAPYDINILNEVNFQNYPEREEQEEEEDDFSKLLLSSLLANLNSEEGEEVFESLNPMGKKKSDMRKAINKGVKKIFSTIKAKKKEKK